MVSLSLTDRARSSAIDDLHGTQRRQIFMAVLLTEPQRAPWTPSSAVLVISLSIIKADLGPDAIKQEDGVCWQAME